jgi:hypothetical protein
LHSGAKGNEDKTVLVGGRAKLPQFDLENSALASIGVTTFKIRLEKLLDMLDNYVGYKPVDALH